MKKILVMSLCILMFSLIVISPVKAIIPGPGTQVAIVPDPSSTNGGTLPSTDAAYANFTFTNLPWANVTAGNLTSYQIVVLLIDDLAPQPLLSPSQVTDLNTWTFNGGKLIIYDSEEPAQDYTWLPYPFNTTNPGQLGGQGQILFMEDNSLGVDDSPASPWYINTTVDYIWNNWVDIIGDANLFTTFDANWCGDIEAENAFFDQGWVHTYAVYGDGLMIYNGFDIDPLSAGTAPGPEDWNALAKIWLLELQQPWGTDYNLPCAQKVIDGAVGGEILATNTLRTLVPYLLILASAIAATAGILYKKKTP